MPKNLVLSRATEADIDALLDPLYAAFEGNDIRTMFFGHDTPASRASAKERIAASMRQGGQNVWLKVVEKETGRVVSGSWWMVYPNWVPSPSLTEAAATSTASTPYLAGPDRTKGEAMLADWMARRARHMYNHPHVLLALLFTHPTAQRSGAGTLHVRWGTALADALLVPWWVEGTPAGHALYAANGAEDVEKVRFQTAGEGEGDDRAWLCEYTVMRREPRRVPGGLEGEGRAVVRN